jgi:hypothetical protein
MPTRELPDAAALARRVCGRPLPGGEFVIPESEASLVNELAGSGSAQPHPIFACIGSLRTLGLSIGDLCALCDFDLADGPLLGEFEAEFEDDFRAGVRYVASGEIESYERVSSRRLGLVDRLGFRVTLATADGAAVARARYLWLLPRGRSAA